MLLTAVSIALLTLDTRAETTATVPQGYVTVTIAAGTGSVYSQTLFAAPLLATENVVGQSAGRITGVTANTISNSNAGWTASALATAGSPYFINITSGSNAGRMFQITANTATQLTINPQGLNLTTLGFSVGANGDSYEIVQGDTLLGILGTPANGVLGGTSAQFSANTIDKVLVNDPNSGSVFSFYYDSSANQWRRLGSNANQGNLVISPKAGLHYSRLPATPLSLQFVGQVPSTASKHQIVALGTSILSNPFPVDTTLAALNIENVPGWRKANLGGVTVQNSDRVLIKLGTSIFSYYFDGNLNQWRRLGNNFNQGAVSVPAGGAIRLLRTGTAGQAQTWDLARPYPLI